ncbi:glutamate synthase large subunit [Virgibacillus profundi]|uniref:Glutamate synthase large subunit n=1 Tax=Virgibacillus profundi TaxID=2024555 RepID=A0A2A2IBN8_9BACI|nr:glutamate synthase large subunit [Virgibacillus profundi]PAV29421.1 glutamate synthase large subunit [Virgibacillus profundi]PXY53591.1 glutamate synthase large subunit [Virgibacillus profundi]
MGYNQLPQVQGLYHPEFEHDACGIGLYAHINGIPTHDIVNKGLDMLCQLKHRGGKGNDPLTGDGAGLMVQLPDLFFRKVCSEINLPEKGNYGVGMLFFPNDIKTRKEMENRINSIIEQEGQIVLGWRTVPINVEDIGQKAKDSCPFVRQLFINAGPSTKETGAFERKLYVIRKQAEKLAMEQEECFYFSSLSSQTIVYKGMLTPEQLRDFYLDLQDKDFVSAFSLVHSRFSTNTFPSWERAHPNRYLMHNGEINTLKGNISWMCAREKQFVSEAFGDDLNKVFPILDVDGSDSSILDNALEFFILAGRKPAHAAMMLIPEPWAQNPHMSKEKKAFYEYHSCLMEPWDGPTTISFTDGKQIGAILDRNGLRPARYYVTKDDYLIFSSEVGVIDIDEKNILYKDRLSPGKLLLLDLEEGRIISDDEIKTEMAKALPYEKWLNTQLFKIENKVESVANNRYENLVTRQKAFGYTYEDVHKYLISLVNEEKDPIGSMGNDAPLAVLSDHPQSLFSYFKQLFAQVTNPPIDAYRESLVTSTISLLGPEGNILHPSEENCRRLQVDTPILSNHQLSLLKNNHYPGFKSRTIHALFSNDLEGALEQICTEAEKAISEGISILILSDRNMENNAAIPALLAVSALHQHLIRQGNRTKVSLIAETGEAREVHHFAALIGYGVNAINPYLAYATLHQAIEEEHLAYSYREAVTRYMKGITEGVVKVMAKMGISTMQSYRGAQIFEAIGISNKVIDRYFAGTASQLGGIELDTIAEETIKRHKDAYAGSLDETLDSGSNLQWRKNGEHHAFNPKTIHMLQWASRRGDYDLFKQYSKAANEERINFLRNLFSFKKADNPLPIEEVEAVESIVKRFKTGAMSFGSLSQEAHESLAIAMNRIGGKSNSGEGGEDPRRFAVDEHGDISRSAIKQIASGRFGVKSHYLVNAEELQIKMAQGAKPGEGGQLPGNKVYPWIADVRGSTPGVGLISPPPHHDIYSIEDLAQLIHDLKNANRHARISVKLVAKAGIGTIASGVAKGAADVISVSGYDGGTGASPKTSIKHTGLPWELGLAETHQTLMLNGLRNRVVLETDGKLMTGKDVVMAALLGAEEYGFATAPLVVLGCVMMRACHLDTCPVGIATQNPELRKKFIGDPEHVVNFMHFIAQEVREIMAALGFRTVEEMVGRTDILTINDRAKNHWKAQYLDLSRLLFQPDGSRTSQISQDHQLDVSLDISTILPAVKTAIEQNKKIDLTYAIKNTNRVTGTIVGSEITKQYGEAGLPEDTITLRFTGSAGQSFGAYIPCGMSLILTGDANDYIGKGLSGGKIIVSSPIKAKDKASSNVITGNVALYGATRGEAYINGLAGERFAVRNSGANAVVEGIGDHGCEYMTGGRVLILGEIGKNFAAGMSGGIAYVLTESKTTFKQLCNKELVEFETLSAKDERERVKQMVHHHYRHTGSQKAAYVLNNWESSITKFVKVIPKDYKLMRKRIQDQQNAGLTDDEASMNAFQTKNKKPSITGRTNPQIIPI